MNKVITDTLERDEALECGRSFIVQAPAGSGKTELLMRRYLRLLSAVESPEQILAMTFTRKAAGEMQSRILASLRRAKDAEPPVRGHEQKTFELAQAALKRDELMGWGLLDNPARLKVQTIDSVCAGLARQMPLLSKTGVPPAVSEDPKELYREAAKRTVEMVEDGGADGEAVRKALSHLDNSVMALTHRLVMMLYRREQWLRHVNRCDSEQELRALLELSLEKMIAHQLGRVKDSFPSELDEWLIQCARYAASNVRDDGGPVAALAGMKGLPGGGAQDLPAWRGIRELLLTKENELRKPRSVNKNIGFPPDKDDTAAAMKKAFQELLGDISVHTGFLSELAGVSMLPPPAFDDAQWEILLAIIRLLPIAQRHLMDVFAGEGEADFQLISMAALEALGNDGAPTDLMLAMDLKLAHILVDEYQDTSRTQLLLLEALTRGWTGDDGRTLFVVGDPMQSIFQFREADVGLFLEARQGGIGEVKLTPLTLKTNFRSDAAIVDWVNGAFERAFPPGEDTVTGAVGYSPSTPARDAAGGGVDVRVYEGKSDEDEAQKAVSIIKGIDPAESVAVLCRSRPHLAGIIDGLKKEGVSFRAQELDSLADRVVINDLRSLLRSLLHPYDRIAWLSALRAPWCGIGMKDLRSLCLNDKESAVWVLLNDDERLKALSDEGRVRVERVKKSFDKALGIRGRIPLRRLIEGLWIELGGPACAPDEASMKDAGAFFDVLSSVSAGAEIDPVKDVDERIRSLYADHGGTPATNVDLMTIHKAKGLEFDHVILPGLGKHTGNEDKKLLLWMERGEDLLLAPVEKKASKDKNPIYEYLGQINKKKRELEMARLFYVAATRARKRLYLCGHARIKDGAVKADRRSFLSCMEGSLGEEMLVRAAAHANGGEPGQTPKPPVLMLKRLPESWRMPQPCAHIDSSRPAYEAPASAPEFLWAGEIVRHMGTVVHRYLCRFAKDGLARWDAARISAEADTVKALLRSAGLGRADTGKAARKTVEILQNALRSSRARWILGAHDEGAVELALSGASQGVLTRSVIDRTFVDGGVRWIIDYKASLHEGGSLQEFLESEKLRYSPQLERYAALLSAAGERREIRKGLYYPALDAWVEI